MSDEPEARDGPNPFSFKTFVKRASTADPSSTASGRRPKSGSKSSSGRKKGEGERKKKKWKPVAGDGEGEGVPFPELGGGKSDTAAVKVSSDEDNPFSFTKFVKRNESKQAFSSAGQERASESSNSSSDDSDDANDVMVLPLRPPSGNFSPSASKKHVKTPNTSSSTLLTSNTGVTSKTRNVKSMSTDKDKTHKLFPDSDSSSDEDGLFSTRKKKPVAMDTVAKPHGSQRGGAELEDLFEESPKMTAVGGLLLQNEEGESSSDDSVSSPGLPVRFGGEDNVKISGTALEQLKKLKAENAKLTEDLQQSRLESSQLKEKNSSLKQKMKALKKKEAEETKALEEMVLKVESNLVTTTKRAISAEATIVKLKQEIASLQTKLAQTTPESVHQHYEEMLSGVREKANYSSQQLVLAAHAADQYIKELAGGVDTLKHVAEILQFIDNICEIKDKSSSTT